MKTGSFKIVSQVKHALQQFLNSKNKNIVSY